MTPAEIQKELDELDHRLERLRIKYDQYFTGIEKMLPYVPRKDVDRRFQLLHREQMRNTGMRFKFQTLVQRFTSYQTYWNRITRQIEEGTYRRDVVRAQRMGLGADAVRQAQNAADNTSNQEQELDADELEEIEPQEPEAAVEASPPSMRPPSLDEPKPERVRPVAPKLHDANEPSVARQLPRNDSDDLSVPPRALTPPPRAAATSPTAAAIPASVPKPAPFKPPVPRAGATPPAAAQPTVPAMSMRPPQPQSSVPPSAPSASPRPSAPSSHEDHAMRQLYDRYIAARKQTGESADVRFETVARQVNATLPRLVEKYTDADVRLDVAIKDGKAILRPIVTMKKKP